MHDACRMSHVACLLNCKCVACCRLHLACSRCTILYAWCTMLHTCCMHISVSHVALRVRCMLHVASHCMLHYPVVSALFFRLQSTHASSHYKKLKFCGPPFFSGGPKRSGRKQASQESTHDTPTHATSFRFATTEPLIRGGARRGERSHASWQRSVRSERSHRAPSRGCCQPLSIAPYGPQPWPSPLMLETEKTKMLETKKQKCRWVAPTGLDFDPSRPQRQQWNC